MARFMVSMPDEMVKQLDRQAKREHRNRSEFLREAVRQRLAPAAPVARQARSSPGGPGKKPHGRKKWRRQDIDRFLLEKGIVAKGCPGLDALLGPAKGPVDMRRVLEIGKKLTGLSREIIEAREDRV